MLISFRSFRNFIPNRNFESIRNKTYTHTRLLWFRNLGHERESSCGRFVYSYSTHTRTRARTCILIQRHLLHDKMLFVTLCRVSGSIKITKWRFYLCKKKEKINRRIGTVCVCVWWVYCVRSHTEKKLKYLQKQVIYTGCLHKIKSSVSVAPYLNNT